MTFFRRSLAKFACIALTCAAGAASAETFTFGIVGDAGMRNDLAPLARDSLLRSNIRQLIMPGDNIYDTSLTYEQVWQPWRDQGFAFDVVALGNHNLSYAGEVDFFDMPGEYFKKEYGTDVLFIVLNSDNQGTAREQAQFLDETLRAATQPFVFVVYHHPSYTLSERHRWEERREFHLQVRPVLWQNRNKITALILGHDHIASLVDVEGLPLIVSGAATEQIPTGRRDYNADDGHHVATKWLFHGEPHWTRLDIDTSARTVWVNFVRIRPEGVDCSARISPRPIELQSNCN